MSALARIANRGPAATMQAIGNMAYASICRAAGQRFVTKKIHNYRLILDLNDPGISRALIMYGERELDHKVMLERYLQPGMRIFDIGGNMGYYPLLELQITKGMGHLVIFEPVPENILLLYKNLKLNGYEQIYVVQAAVSDKTGTRSFAKSNHSNLGTFHPVNGSGEAIEVKTISYSDAVKSYGKPDFVRMDIEGHEATILECILKSASRPIIIFETHYDRYPDFDMGWVLLELFRAGYHCPLVSTANDAATAKLMGRGYDPGKRIRTDATYRTLFSDIEYPDLVDFVLRRDGVRTVVLSPHG